MGQWEIRGIIRAGGLPQLTNAPIVIYHSESLIIEMRNLGSHFDEIIRYTYTGSVVILAEIMDSLDWSELRFLC